MKYSFFLYSAIACLFFIPTPASADQEDFVARLRNCKELSSIVQRAQCFDTVLDEYDLNTLKKNSGGKQEGGWKLVSYKSTMTDNTNVTLTLPSNEHFADKDGVQTRASLALSCIDGRPNAYISWNTPIGFPNNPVERKENVANTRFGTDPVIAENWTTSTDKTASFIPNPVEFYKKVLNPSGLYFVKLWPRAFYDTISVTFDVRGLGEKFQPLKEACKLP